MFNVSSKDDYGEWLSCNFLATSQPAYIGKLGLWRYLPQTSIDTVFSQRTGRPRKGSLSREVKYSEYVNQRRTSLASKLKRRKDLTESYRKELLDPTVSNGGVTHFNSVDVGNPFAVVHRRRMVVPDTITTTGTSTCVWDGIPTYLLPDQNGGTLSGRGTFSGFNWTSYTDVSSLLTATGSSLALSGQEKTKLQSDLISRLNPYRNEMAGLTAIGEIVLGGMPNAFWRLDNFRRNVSTSMGNLDLNLRFGWAPLAADIKELLWACLRLDQMLVAKNARRRRRFKLKTVDYVKDTGLSVNEGRVSFPTNVGTHSGSNYGVSSLGKILLSSTNPGYDVPLSFSVRYQKGVRFCHQEISINFTANYSNGVKSNPTMNGYVDRALEFLGLELTPDVVYNLTPWTWMLDWFTNLGSLVNYTSNFGLSNNVLNYAYFTQHITTQRGAFLWSPPISTVARKGATMIREETTEVVREQASPLGFGASWPTLTQSQLDILTAFGITRPR